MENIGWFDVPVEVALLEYIEVSADNLLYNLARFVVRKLFFLFQQSVEVPLHQFSDQVGVVFGGINIVEMENMGRTCQSF